MKPVLILNEGTNQAWDGYLARRAIRMLKMMNIPYKVFKASDTQNWPAGYDLRFSVCLIPEGNANWADMRSWMRGERLIPTVVAWGSNTALLNNAEVTTGATARYATNAAPFSGSYLKFSDADGNNFYTEAAANAYGYDVSGEGVESLIWHANGKTVLWRRKGTNRWVYFCGLIGVVQLSVITALAACDETPVSFPIRIDIDDVEELTTTRGMTDLAEWLRERRAVALCGIDVNTSALHPATPLYKSVKNVLLANADVFKFVVHADAEPVDKYWKYDTDDFATVDGKLAAHRTCVNEITNQGFECREDGFDGHYYMVDNNATTMGYQAMAKAGVKLLRTASGAHLFGSNRGEFLYREGPSEYSFRAVPCISIPFQSWSDTTIASSWAANSADTEEKYGWRVQEYNQLPYILGCSMRSGLMHVPRPIVYSHGPNFDDDGTSAKNNPGLNFLTYIDAYVRHSGGWLKWAGPDDLRQMARRRQFR